MSLRSSVFVLLLTAVIVVSGCRSDVDGATPAEQSDGKATATTSEEVGLEDSETITPTAPTAMAPSATERGQASATDNSDLVADEALLQGPAPPAGYRPLLPTHNRLDADRINLVFDPDSGVNVDPEMLDPLLSWDEQPQLQGGSVVFGLFAIEPFRSNRHLFNLWVGDHSVIERDEFGGIPDGTFPDMVSIRLSPEVGRASAVPSQFAPLHGTSPSDDVVLRDLLEYRKGHIGSLLLYANDADFAFEGPTLAHELGHALFGVGDEYYGETGEANPEFVSEGEWPNCAVSRQQAEDWWGDLDGAYDPMIDIWIEESSRLGVDFSEDEIAAFRQAGTVDLDNGHAGCYDREGYFRPTFRGLMGLSDGPPAFGPVNRRWAERILASYTGEIPSS